MTDAEAGADDSAALLRAAAGGDAAAWAAVVARYGARLRRTVALRLSRRLQGRLDEADVLQEAFLGVHRALPDYVADPHLPPFLWVRHRVGLKLAEVHRRHLGTLARDADREVTIHRGGLPGADSASLAAALMGSVTSPSRAAERAELRLAVQAALAQLDPDDREVLALKHFEQLSTVEVAAVLGLSKAGAGHRYVRAAKRLRAVLASMPGFPAP